MNPRSCSRALLTTATVQGLMLINGGWYTHTSTSFSGRVRDDPPWAVNAALHFGDTPQLGTEKHGVLHVL